MALTNIAKLLRINVRTCFDWASFCREVVYYAMLSRKEPLGGPGKVVEIDESKFGRRKYHRGHCVEGQWVFGGYERGSGKVFMVPVDKRDRSTLVPLIQEWIRPGTTIISDCWKAYEGLQELGYQHLTVNNSVTFKDSKTGAHTNSIEGTWRGAKAILSAPGQRKKAHLPGNLAKYMFLKRCRDLGLEDFIEFCKYAGELYDPRRPRPNQFEAGVDSSQESVGSTSHATIGEATVTASTANREGTSAIASMEEYDKDTTSIDSAVEHEATAPIDSAEEYNMPEHNLNT